MMISRRQFLATAGLAGAAAGIPKTLLAQLYKVANVKDGKGNLPVLWFQAQSCSGCSVSLLNSEYPSIDEVLIELISLNFHSSIMAGQGDVATGVIDTMIEEMKGEFLLVVEGSIPVGANGEYSTMGEKEGKSVTVLERIKDIAASAKAVVSVGACASFGGIPAAGSNPTGAKPASEIITDKPLINLPGCPAHPAWVIGTIINVLTKGIPDLDEEKRPTMYYGKDKVVHDNCERRYLCDKKIFAKDFGDEGCLYELGCRGPIAHCDASTRGWNGNGNWCVRSGGPCIGCTEPDFPGSEFSSFYYYK